MNPKKPTLLGTVILILGLILVLWGGFILFQETPQNKWRTTTGTILDKQVIVVGQEDREGVALLDGDLIPSNNQSNEKTNFRFYPMVYYEYIVDDKIYQSDLVEHPQLVYFSETDQSFEAERILDKYEIGESILIYYDPDNPTTAVLISQNNQQISEMIIPILVGFFLIAIVIVQIINQNPLKSSILVSN